VSDAADVRLRVAVPDDAPRLARVAARLFAETFGADNTPEDMAAYLASAYGPERQRAELEDRDARVWLAEADGAPEPVGFAHLHRAAVPASLAAEPAAEVVRLYVDRPWHGRGVAARLMDACVEQARAWRCATLWLGVWERNPRAIAFYERQGFRRAGTKTFTLGRDVQTDLVMLREI